jgi:O-antigen ligase
MKKQSGKTTHSAKKTKPVFLWLVFIPAVVVIPLIQSHNTSDPVLTARFLALSITVFVTVLYVIVKNKKEFFPAGFIKLPVFTIFLIYFIWSALSLVWSVNPSEGLFDVTKTFLSLALLIFTVQLFLKYDNAFAFLTKGIIAASFVATTLGLVQYVQHVPGLTGYQQFMALYEVKGLMAHKNQFAVSLFLMIPFVLSGIFVLNRWWRIAGAVSLLLIMLNIVLVQTRSVWMATLVFIFVSGALWIWVEIRNRHPHKKRLLKRMVMVTGLAAVLFVASLIAV